MKKLLIVLFVLNSTFAFAASTCVLDSKTRSEGLNIDWEFESPEVLADGHSLSSISAKSVKVNFHAGEYNNEYSVTYTCKKISADIRFCSAGKGDDHDEFAIQQIDKNFKVYQIIANNGKKTLNPKISGIFRCI